MKLKLSTKAVLWLITAIIVTMSTSVVALVYAWQIRYTQDEAIAQDVREIVDAAELNIVLLKQNNLLTFHLIKGDNPKWMKEVDNLKPISRNLLQHLQETPAHPKEKEMLISLHKLFDRYDVLRDNLLDLFKSGDPAGARNIAFTDLAGLSIICASKCDELVRQKKHDIQEVLKWSKSESKKFSIMVIVSIFLTISLGSGLVWMLYNNIFSPLKKIAREIQNYSTKDLDEARPRSSHQDDLETLVSGLKIFMAEVEKTRSDLEQSRHQLLQASSLAAIGNTVAQVAHEIKNRLIIVGGIAGSIEKKAENSELTRKKATIIFQEVNKLERLLKQISEFSKPIQLETKVFSLNVFLETLMTKLANVAPQNISLKMSLSPDIPDVRIDYERLEQVIINLIKNAMEAMVSSGNIYVSTCIHEKGVALIIKDEGPGMTEEVRNHIFDPFYTTKKEGTGLGLAIARKIILDHGGELTCDSFPQKGTTFTITLPQACGKKLNGRRCNR